MSKASAARARRAAAASQAMRDRASGLAYDDPRQGEVREILPQDAYRASERFDEQLVTAHRTHTHVWITMATFTLPVEELIASERDRRSIAMHPQHFRMAETGCYVCEQRFSLDIARGRCPGDPADQPSQHPAQPGAAFGLSPGGQW